MSLSINDSADAEAHGAGYLSDPQESALQVYEDVISPYFDLLWSRVEWADLAAYEDARNSVASVERQVVYYLKLPESGNEVRLLGSLNENNRVTDVYLEIGDGKGSWTEVPFEDRDQTETFAAMIGCHVS